MTVTPLAPNTPVIVGVGFRQEKSDDPTRCPEAYQLMVDAARSAAGDAGPGALLGQIESISVTQGLWLYPNPGQLIGEALGCPKARSGRPRGAPGGPLRGGGSDLQHLRLLALAHAVGLRDVAVGQALQALLALLEVVRTCPLGRVQVR